MLIRFNAKFQGGSLMKKAIVNLTVLVLLSCSEAVRENIVDPVVAPSIEMSVPVLDDGTILLEWRYLSEDSDLTEFVVRRIVNGDATEVGRFAAGLASEWRTLTTRDSTLVAGVDVTYRVTGILTGGSETSSDSKVFRMEGTELTIAVDPRQQLIQLSWMDVPDGATGFSVVRRSGEDSTIIYTSEDLSQTSFVDMPPLGNTHYTYEVVTHLGEVSIVSNTQQGGLYLSIGSIKLNGTTSLVLGGSTRGGDSAIFTLYFDSQELKAVYTGSKPIPEFYHDLTDNISELVNVTKPDIEIGSISASHASQQDYFQGDEVVQYTGWLSSGGSTATFSAYDFSLLGVDRSVSFAVSNATRTGISPFNRNSIAFAGTKLYTLNGNFDVIEELELPDGEEPLDIHYASGSIWLAYADRVVKSVPTESILEDLGWQTAYSAPSGGLVAIESYEGRLVILDAISSSVLITDEDGMPLVSWPAIGSNLDEGGLAVTLRDSPGDIYIFQADGVGGVHVFEAEGSVSGLGGGGGGG
jgi:hypothetical protein